MVPLFILCTRKPLAKNPRGVHIRELFTTPPELERDYFRDARKGGWLGKVLLVVDRLSRRIDPFIPKAMRERATRAAEQWMLERLNGEDGLGAIFPAMVNALEVDDHPGIPGGRSAPRDCEARIAEAPGRGSVERLLPAVRIARVGHRVDRPRHAGGGLRAVRQGA